MSLAILLEEAADGFWPHFPCITPAWGLKEVTDVSLYGIPLGIGLALLGQASIEINIYQLQITEGMQPTTLKAIGHLGQEGLLDVAIIGLLTLALGKTDPLSKGFFSYSISSNWLLICLLLTCLFPVVDPILYTPWKGLLHSISAGLGEGLTDGAYEAVINECKSNGDSVALFLHFISTCVLGPIWEETFWRGFILPSISSRLPRNQAPLAIVLSSATFSSLHLALSAGPTIFLISSLCDFVTLRSLSIGSPLVIHSLFNAYQFLGALLLDKDFV